MSLYLPEWEHGYETFRDFAETAWNPCIECEIDDFDSSKIKAAVYFMDVDMVNDFAESLDDDFSKEFVSRFNFATNFLLNILEVKKFIYLNYNEALKVIKDPEQANVVINVAFQQFVMEYEFWNKTSITENYANLIFYGMLSDPRPIFFAIPPKNEWDTKYRFGWAGYPHPINFFD